MSMPELTTSSLATALTDVHGIRRDQAENLALVHGRDLAMRGLSLTCAAELIATTPALLILPAAN